MKKENSQIRLNRIMEERGLRQVDIMRLSEPWQKKLDIKMSKNYLSQYVNGKSNPDQSKLVLLSKTLGVSEPWLMGYDVPRDDSEISYNSEPLIKETVKTMKKLEEPRQKIVLETASTQLSEQEKAVEEAKKRERKILSLDKPPVDIKQIPGYMPYNSETQGTAPILGDIAAGYNIMAEENFDGMLPVSAEYADRDDIFWLHIRGTSMEALIHDGAFGLFENCSDVEDGIIAAVVSEDGGFATVKYIYHEYDENGYLLRVLLVPENEEHQTLVIDEYNPAKIIGKLVEVKQFF